MQSEYNVYFQEKHVGKVTIMLQGLYFCFSCSCILEKDQIYELVFISNNTEKSLGILMPKNGRFTLSKKIPAKYFQEKEITFKVIIRENMDLENFYTVNEAEPFLHIKHIENAVVTKMQGKLGVRFLK